MHWCVFGPCKQTEHGLFTTAPEQNSSHLSQQQKPTGKRAELYLVYIVALFDWLTQIRLFFKDKSVSLRKNCAHAAKMKDEFIGRSLQKGRKLRASVCRGTLSKEHKFDFILLLFHLQTWTRSNLNKLQSLLWLCSKSITSQLLKRNVAMKTTKKDTNQREGLYG